MLVHGGAGPELTWAGQLELAARWTVIVPWRRGFVPSPKSVRQDFEIDAVDIEALLDCEGNAHLVGFSYGAVGAVLAATRRPDLVRSLTLVEPALLGVLPHEPTVQAFVALSAAALGEDSAALGEFLHLAGLDASTVGAESERAIERARGLREPWEAKPDFETLARAQTPSVVISGVHSPAIELICDEVARRMAAERWRLPGHGHAAQRSPSFNESLEVFLESAERKRDPGCATA
jgi:pimeloyl-ACP methyl ester carboxylesterase